MENNSSRFDANTPSRRRGYGLALMALLLVIGLMATLTYIATMGAMGWVNNRDSGLSVPLGPFFKARDAQIFLYKSPETTRYFAAVGGNYEVLLKPWRNFFVQQNMEYKEVTEVARLPESRNAVLILPSTVSISDNERKAILKFRDRGGNILATSTLGARNGAGEWTGYDFVKDLFGVSVTGEVPPDKEERHLNLFGDLPFSQGYGVAERIWLGKLGSNPLRLKGGNTAGLIMDWARTPAVEQGAEAPAVIYDEYGGEKQYARWVMLSFSEVSWEVQRNDVHILLANALGWLEHRPAVYKASWPFPYRAAHVVEMDTEEGFPNAKRFSVMMEKIDATATFYTLTSVALRYPDLVKELSRRHEMSYHGDVHDSFKGQAQALQEKRLDTMQAQMKSILGNTNDITGFRAPTEGYDQLTLDLLVEKGIRHHAADPNSSNARLPFFYPGTEGAGGKALVVLPRTQRDDINLMRAGHDSEEQIAQALISDFDQVMQMGAFGLLSIHTQNFAEDSPLAAAMPDFLKHAANNRDKVWLAPSGKVADWWHHRERLIYKVSQSGAKTDLDVSVIGDGPLPAVSLIVTNPSANATPTVRPVKTNTVLPVVKPLDEFRTALVFSNMPAGSYSYSLTFNTMP